MYHLTNFHFIKSTVQPVVKVTDSFPADPGSIPAGTHKSWDGIQEQQYAETAPMLQIIKSYFTWYIGALKW